MMASAMAVVVEMTPFLAMRFGHFGGRGAGGGGVLLAVVAIAAFGTLIWAAARAGRNAA
jgi:hypothetical protein